MEQQSGHIAVAIDTKLLSERLDSSVIIGEREKKTEWETWKSEQGHPGQEEKLSQKIRSRERVKVKWKGWKVRESECESKGKENWVRVRLRERERVCRTETALPARGLSGLQAAEQWQETSAWNFSLRAGMRAPYPGSRGPAPPCVQQRCHSVRSSGQGWPQAVWGGSTLGVGCTLRFINFFLNYNYSFTAGLAIQHHTLHFLIVTAESFNFQLISSNSVHCCLTFSVSESSVVKMQKRHFALFYSRGYSGVSGQQQ